MADSSQKNVRLLTAIIVVRNAAEGLEETLRSVQGVADEILVLDTGSRDATPEVARRYGVDLLERPWDDDFSAARNFAWRSATSKWVLWIDAGERLAPSSMSSLRNWLLGRAEQIQVAWLMNIRLPCAQGQVGAEQAARIRLVPNRSGLRFEGRVRESLLPSLAALEMKAEVSPFIIERGTREHDPQVKLRKARRDLDLTERAIAEHGPQARWLNCQGEAWHALGDGARAAECFRRAVQLAPRGSTEMLEAYYGILAALDTQPNSLSSQLAVCLQALEILPLDVQLLSALGGYLQAQGRLDLSSRAYETAHRFGQLNPETWHLVDLAEIAINCHALTLLLQERYPQACEVLEMGLAEHPESARLRRQLMEVHLKLGRRDEALAQIDHLPAAFAPSREALRSVVRGAALVSEGNAEAGLSHLRIGYKSGCRDPICYRWYTLALLATNQRQEALPLLMEWQAIDLVNGEAHRILASLQTEPLDSTSDAPSMAQKSVRVDSRPASMERPLFGAPSHAQQPSVSIWKE